MITMLSIYLIIISSILSCFAIRNPRNPIILFTIIWTVVCIVNICILDYIELDPDVLAFVAIMLVSFLVGGLIVNNIHEKQRNTYINEGLLYKIFYLSIFIQLLTLMLLLYEAHSFSGSIVEYINYMRTIRMVSDESDYPGLLGNSNVMRVIKNNYLFNYLLLIIYALRTPKLNRVIILCVIFRLLYAGLTGSRWQGVMDILTLAYIYLDRNRDLIKPIIKYAVVFMLFFMVAGTLRSTAGFGFDYFVMYVFGGLPAFGELYKSPDLYYLPNTAIYIEQLLGITSSGIFDIVADSVWLNDNIKTNTFSIFGTVYKYYGELGSIVYFFLYGFVLNYLFKNRQNGVLLPCLYYMIVPTVMVSVFMEGVLALAPLIIRLLALVVLLKIILRNPANAA